MLFVFFPLDIVWLDAAGKVQEWRTLRPWTMHTPRVASAWVLELPAGTCRRTGIGPGERILLSD